MIALFLATFEFAMLITNKNKKLSLIVTMLITFSPLVHWWFAVNNLVEMIVFAEIAIVLIDKYLLESNFKKRIFLSSMVMLCAGNYMFCTYPAWLVPTTYVFLPSLIWVFYKNRKDIKFTKKDILVLVLEVLILTGLVLRIFVKSIDAINLISNTAYPGKRVSTGGEIESLIQLITGNINLITPYTNKYENPCEIALVMDFFPITILLLIFSIIKNKTKDFLLYFMLGISIFLNIYCIIGFPEIIAKITFMSLSVSNRTKGVIGIINVFILARLLAINKENVFSVKLSAILSIIISLSIGEYIRYCYKEYFDIWQFIAIDVLLNLIIGESSSLYQELYKSGVILNMPSFEYEFTDEYAHILISGVSRNPEIFFDMINKEIDSLAVNGINEQDFERVKKMIYGEYIKEYNDVSNIARIFLTDFMKGVNSFDYIEEITTLDIEYAKQVLIDNFKKEKMVFSVVKAS